MLELVVMGISLAVVEVDGGVVGAAVAGDVDRSSVPKVTKVTSSRWSSSEPTRERN
jgi:hypothetical protein